MTAEKLQRLQGFLDSQGRLKSFPVKREKQRLVLEYLAEQLEPEHIYTEKEIVSWLNARHTFGDPCLLRRELYDSGLVDRKTDGTAYWREPPKEIL